MFSLPDDVVLNIGENLDGRSVARFSSVSKQTNNVLTGTHSSMPRYNAELAKVGMADGGSTQLPVELLPKLLAYHDAWSQLNWSQVHEIPLYVSDRIVCFGDEVHVPVSSYIPDRFPGNSFMGVSGGCVYYAQQTHDLRWYLKIFLLPSFRSGQTFECVEHNFQYPAIKFVAIDPAQSLVVLLFEDPHTKTSHLSFRDLRYRTGHPEAHSKTLWAFQDSKEQRYTTQLEICGTMIGLLASPNLQFINWRTGERIRDKGRGIVSSFHFLNPNQALIGEYSEAVGGMPRLRAYDLRDPRRSKEFDFPRWPLIPTSLSFVRNVSSTSGVVPKHTLFYPDPSVRLLGIKLDFGWQAPQKGMPEHPLFVIPESYFTVNLFRSESTHDWFSHCRHVSPQRGNGDIAFVGRWLLSSDVDPNHYTSTISLYDLNPGATENAGYSGGWQQHPRDNSWQAIKLASMASMNRKNVPITMTNARPNVIKVLATEDNLILFPGGGNIKILTF